VHAVIPVSADRVEGAMPIRVLHLIDSLVRGGAEQQLVNLLQAYDPKEVSSTVVTLVDHMHLAGPLHSIGIPIHTLGLRRAREWPLALGALYRLMREIRPDVLHTRLAYAGIMGQTVATMWRRARVVSSVEAPVYSDEVWDDTVGARRWKLELVRVTELVTSRLSGSTYVACSKSVARSIQSALHLPDRRLRVIYNSTSVADGDGEPAAAPVPAPGGATLLTVGRLSPQKGQVYLLRAMPLVLERCPATLLQIVGKGPQEDMLRRECEKLGITGSVAFLGERDDVGSLLRQADIFVLPSLWEGLSIAALEALAAGLPIVASDIPSMQEVVEAGVQGVLVEPKRPERLADAILRLLQDPSERRCLATAARKRALEHFDVSVAAREFEGMYRALVGA
jgi:glycosyltransferase involved in cell wall biosynthesis